MKYMIAVALFAAICAVVRTEEVCHNNLVNVCSQSTLSMLAGMFAAKTSGGVCNSRYGGIDNTEPEIQAYINSQLTKSYEYLLMATNFNSYQKNRPGFEKLYRTLSDRSFEDTINLIKQVTRRGGKIDFNSHHQTDAQVSKQSLNMELDELHSLGVALDNEKQLAKGAIHVHTRATHNSDRDPEMAHYLEEKFLSSQAETIRKLSGYANDLTKLMNNPDPSLAIYLFDEYLQKQ